MVVPETGIVVRPGTTQRLVMSPGIVALALYVYNERRKRDGRDEPEHAGLRPTVELQVG